MKNILVTGGSGFIGSHTCLNLLERNYKVIVLDSLINSDYKTIANIRRILPSKEKSLIFIEGDLRDEKIIEKIFIDAIERNEPIDGVIHFAALKSVGDSVKNPLIYWESNLFGSISLFKVMKKFNCRRIIFSSSASIYAHSNDINLSENSNIKPCNPYGNTKATIEQILRDIFYSEQGKWRIANLRYFNPIGAYPLGGLGENYSGNPTNIFPLILLVAAKKKKRIEVFGDSWPTPDGTGIRDYIHVMDLAEGHIAALDYLEENKPQIIDLNLGTGKGISVLELINKFEEVNNIKIPYVISDPRDGDLARTVANNKLAISLLKWKPLRNLEDMCRDGWSSFKEKYINN